MICSNSVHSEKRIVTPEDWEIMEQHIQYDFLYDNHFSELKESELMQRDLVWLQLQNHMLVNIILKIM